MTSEPGWREGRIHQYTISSLISNSILLPRPHNPVFNSLFLSTMPPPSYASILLFFLLFLRLFFFLIFLIYLPRSSPSFIYSFSSLLPPPYTTLSNLFLSSAYFLSLIFPLPPSPLYSSSPFPLCLLIYLFSSLTSPPPPYTSSFNSSPSPLSLSPLSLSASFSSSF